MNGLEFAVRVIEALVWPTILLIAIALAYSLVKAFKHRIVDDLAAGRSIEVKGPFGFALSVQQREDDYVAWWYQNYRYPQAVTLDPESDPLTEDDYQAVWAEHDPEYENE